MTDDPSPSERELLAAIDNLKARLFGCTDANEAAELRQAIGERTQQVHMLRRTRRQRASAATGLDAAGCGAVTPGP